MQHDQFQVLLDALVKNSGVGQEVLGEVMARASLRAPEETSRLEISAGNPSARRPVDQREIPQGTVSKAVKALIDEGLLEDGEKVRKTPGGRTLAPVRLGSRYVSAGVKVVQDRELPAHVTTALVGLDSSRVLGTSHGKADSWDQVADLIHQHVAALKLAYDQERVSQQLPPARMFGVGVEVGAPVRDGEVMPLSPDGARHPVPLAEKLRLLFETDPSVGQPVPVIVENDVNALAVLAIHQIHYTDPDLVVVGVFNEGVGGGLVMDGRLRRGANGRAMEIGHLAVGFPPGKDPDFQGNRSPSKRVAQPPTSATGFNARCYCGQLGHVDTLATPRRIVEELGGGTLERITAIDASVPGSRRARHVLASGGAALGRALAHVSNTVNPSRIILYLPAELARPVPGTAGEAYLAAMRTEITHAFAAREQPGYLKIEPFPPTQGEIALLGAGAAAVCVLESFIEHALRLDGCAGPSRAAAAPR